jgi:hypothetical protein
MAVFNYVFPDRTWFSQNKVKKSKIKEPKVNKVSTAKLPSWDPGLSPGAAATHQIHC